MFPKPMIPREWPRGLCERMAALVWQSWKASGEARAAVVHQLRFRKVARMWKMAKSATDSAEAAALSLLLDLDLVEVVEGKSPVAVYNTYKTN